MIAKMYIKTEGTQVSIFMNFFASNVKFPAQENIT